MPGWVRWLVAGMAAVIAGLAVALAVVASGGETPALTAAPATAPEPTTTIGAPPATEPPPSTLPAIAWEEIGRSVMGRPMRAATFGDGPVRVYVLAGIHGDERAAVDTGPLLAAAWAAGGLPEGVTVRLAVDVNPDGIVAATRANAAGVDLNRNFPTADFVPREGHGDVPLSEPESAALAADIEAFGPAVIVALHCEWEGPFVNFDGPAGVLAAAFVAGAAGPDPAWEIRPELPYPTPGSLGTSYGQEGGLPVVTLEMSRFATAGEHWPAMRAGMAALLEAAARGRPAPASASGGAGSDG